MSHVRATVLLKGTKGTQRVEMLVDTGSTYMIVPPGLADQVGLKAGLCGHSLNQRE